MVSLQRLIKFETNWHFFYARHDFRSAVFRTANGIQLNDRKRQHAAAILLEKIVRQTYTRRKSNEIQPLQWSILRYLDQRSGQKVSLNDLATYLGLTPAPVSRATDTLVSKGLIVKKRNPDHGRERTLAISQSGIDELKNDPICNVADHLAEISNNEFEQFSKVVRHLAINLEIGNAQ